MRIKNELVGWFYDDKYHCTECAYREGMDSEKSEDSTGTTSQPVYASEIEGEGVQCETCTCKMSELCEE